MESLIFCQDYRQGNRISLEFDRLPSSSTPPLMLFNHGNKSRGTEARTVRFGKRGALRRRRVDALMTRYIPAGLTMSNPKKVESIGIRSRGFC